MEAPYFIRRKPGNDVQFSNLIFFMKASGKKVFSSLLFLFFLSFFPSLTEMTGTFLVTARAELVLVVS